MISYDEFTIRQAFNKHQGLNELLNNRKKSDEDLYLNQFLDELIRDGKPFTLIVEEFNHSVNEGILRRVVGGLTGLALGKAIGGFLVRVFQLQPGSVLHKILTSSLFYMAVGAAIGKDRKKNSSIG